MKKFKSILLIDDDSVNNFITRKLIERNSISDKIAVQLNGKDGLDYIRSITEKSNLPDVIFLDINMPVMDGWDFLNEFCKFNDQLASPIPVYMVSSSVHEQDITKSRTYKCVRDFISKPLGKKNLIEILDNFPSDLI